MERWYSQPPEAVEKALEVSVKSGLSAASVLERRATYGENKLKGKPKKSIISLFLSQMKDALIYVLLGAAAITIFIGEYVDSVIILSIVILNGVIGVVQEYKAERAIEALQKLSTPKALVRREGGLLEIPSAEIVPGDIILLDAGRYVLADIRLTESVNLQIEESALTGESVPSDKDASALPDGDPPLGDRKNMAFMSTLVTYGRGEGIAIGTGMDTEMGKIARILDEADSGLTPLQKRLEALGKTLGIMAVGISALILVISFFQKRPLMDMFLTAISLAVAAIPEGLAAIVAIVLALGVTRMSKINAIVKKLPAVETLGSVNIVCSDKTGTLTQNKMTVVRTVTLDTEIQDAKAPPSPLTELLSTALVLSSDATATEDGSGTGDPTEIALIALGNALGLEQTALNARYPRVSEKPFDSDRKLMSTGHRLEAGYRVYTKGAIDSLLPLCTHVIDDAGVRALTESDRTVLTQWANALSDEALRILAAAYKDISGAPDPETMEQSLIFIGMVGMMDPPRTEVAAAIEEAKRAGIRPIMITGDHRNTAYAIAKSLGIAERSEQSITGAELNTLSDEDLARTIDHYRVFARVSPEHKVRIVQAFKLGGNIVSMTGDGVNDAPSLKYADIGVAMGITGTDVSKSASDMILTDDNFSTIIHAIEEGRNIYSNIKKSVIFLLSCNLGEVITVLMSIIFAWPVPLLATQILWINLITDSLPAISLGVDPGDPDVMSQPPRDPKEGFFAKGAGIRAALGGVLIGALTLTGFYWGILEHGYTPGAANIPEHVITYARTIAFVVLAASQLFYAFSMRHSTKSIFQVGILKNMPLVGSVIAGLLLQLAVISIPFFASAFKVQMLSLQDWGIVLALALAPLALNELLKIGLRLRAHRTE